MYTHSADQHSGKQAYDRSGDPDISLYSSSHSKSLRLIRHTGAENFMPPHRMTGIYFSFIVTVHCVPSNTLRDAQIWSILLHIALAASGFSCLRPENTSRDSGM